MSSNYYGFLRARAIDKFATIWERTTKRWLKENLEIFEIIEIAEKFGSKVLFCEHSPDLLESHTILIFSLENCFYRVTIENPYSIVSIDIASAAEPRIDEIIKNLSPIFGDPTPAKKKIFCMISCNGELKLKQLGDSIETSFEFENYTTDIFDKYKHIQKCMSSSNPCGRLVLLDGDPGTGKSYFIRSIVNEIEATFVMVPSAMVGQLSGPNLLPLLMEKAKRISL
jgi:chromosomal replication initiation ATPase DnaA